MDEYDVVYSFLHMSRFDDPRRIVSQDCYTAECAQAAVDECRAAFEPCEQLQIEAVYVTEGRNRYLTDDWQ